MASRIIAGSIGADFDYSSFDKAQLLTSQGDPSAVSGSGSFRSCMSSDMYPESAQQYQSNYVRTYEQLSKTSSRGEESLRAANQAQLYQAQIRYQQLERARVEQQKLLSKQQHFYGSVASAASVSNFSHGASSSRGVLSPSADYVCIPVASERNSFKQDERERDFSAASTSASSRGALASPPLSPEEYRKIYLVEQALKEAAERERILKISDENKRKRFCRANSNGCLATHLVLFAVLGSIGFGTLVDGLGEGRQDEIIFSAVWLSVFGGLCGFASVVVCAGSSCCEKVNNYVCNWLRTWYISREEARVISRHPDPCICQGFCNCDGKCKDLIEALASNSRR